MDHPQKISAKRLEQLKNMAEARMEMGQATPLEKAIPELVAALEPVPEAKHTDNTAEDTDQLIEQAQVALQTARSKTHMVHEGRYVYDMEQRRFLHVGSDGSERTMFRAFEFSFDEQNVALWAFNDASRMVELVQELISGPLNTIEDLEQLSAEKRVAVELINAEGLTGEYVHRLDAEGLVEHTVHDPDAASTARRGDQSGSEAILHLYPLAGEHGDAMISANPEGLRILKERIEGALAATTAGGYYIDHGYSDDPEQQLFAADGEGYNVTVECRPAGVHDPDWQDRPEPYYVPRRRAREAGMEV